MKSLSTGSIDETVHCNYPDYFISLPLSASQDAPELRARMQLLIKKLLLIVYELETGGKK